MEDLREHQHEISDLAGNNGLVFGTEDTGYLTTSRPTHESNGDRNSDKERTREDGMSFGVDYLGGKTVTFEIALLTDRLGDFDPYKSNLAYLDQLEGFWKARRWRNDPRAYAMLRSCEAGETWRAYGRPRSHSESVGPLTPRGYSQALASFVLMDQGWYSDDEFDASVTLSAGSEGGLKAPLVAPLGLTQPSTGEAPMTIGGTRETWPAVEIHGPINEGEVTIGQNFVVGITGGLGPSDYIVVDSAPWARTVTRYPDGAAVPGRLSGRSTPISDMFLDPGDYIIRLTGKDPTGTAYARIRWRNSRWRPGATWPIGGYHPPPDDGPDMPTEARAGLWTGYGPPPDVDFGAKPEDEYLDLLSGNVYVLH